MPVTSLRCPPKVPISCIPDDAVHRNATDRTLSSVHPAMTEPSAETCLAPLAKRPSTPKSTSSPEHVCEYARGPSPNRTARAIHTVLIDLVCDTAPNDEYVMLSPFVVPAITIKEDFPRNALASQSDSTQYHTPSLAHPRANQGPIRMSSATSTVKHRNNRKCQLPLGEYRPISPITQLDTLY